MKEQFISKLHLKKEKRIELTWYTKKKKKKKKSRTQRKSNINKRKENKEELAKDRTWKFVGASDSKCF